jgi:hypothetical protein
VVGHSREAFDSSFDEIKKAKDAIYIETLSQIQRMPLSANRLAPAA